MSRKTVIAVVVVLVVASGLYWSSLRGVPVEVATVEVGPIRTYVEERAKTRLPETYRITMPLNGRILPIRLKERDAVTAGQVVAEMDPADLETAVSEGTARVERLRNTIVESADNRLEKNSILGFDEYLKSMALVIESAQLQTTSGLERQKYADKEYHRKSALFEQNVVSDSERSEAELFQIESRVTYQKDVLVLRALEAVYSAMKIGRQSIQDYIDKKSLRRAVLEQEQKEAEADRERLKRDRSRVVLKSPIAGVVLSRLVSNERVLPAGEVLLEIGNLEELEVEAEVLTQDVVDIKVGHSVDIEGPAIGPAPIGGTVARIYPQGFTKVSSLGVEQQRVLVIIHFDAEDLQTLKQTGRELGADYRVRVKIYTAQKDDAMIVPRSALFRSAAGTWQAFVIRDGKARLVDLEIGLANDFEVEVLSGVDSGERVILAPESSLSDGTRVESTTR